MADPVALLQQLIRCPSVTPKEGGAITLLEKVLTEAGFACQRLKFSAENTPDVDNLYARWGTDAPNLCFAGHTDVVPVGDENAWSVDPFGGTLKDGKVWGRGASDMKGAIAAFVAAALDCIESGTAKGSLSLLITGDEEGPAVNGTKKVLEYLAKQGETIDACIVGEPTSAEQLGDTVKIGRRGSLNGKITVTGRQGHVAYPQLADNPVPKMLTLLKAVDDLVLDKGTAHFDPSNFEIVTVDVGNPAENVIPASVRAVFNVRFNDTYTGASLEKKLRETMDSCKIPYEMTTRLSGESFYTPPGPLSARAQAAIKKVTGREASLSTTGGTSDARFIRQYAPVVELGVLNKTAHQVDEHVPAEHITQLTAIYKEIIQG